MLSFATTAVLATIAPKVGLVDKPDRRKMHVGVIPSIGGLALLFTSLLSLAFWLEAPVAPKINQADAILLAGAVTGLVIMCTADNLRPISPGKRLTAEILFAFGVVQSLDLSIGNLGDLLGTGNIKLHGFFATVLASIAIAGLLNACNMLDGMDGLLPMLAIASAAPIYFLTSNVAQTLVSTLTVYLCVFLLFNFQASKRIPKCFLGDTGSKLIGLFLATSVLVASSSAVGEKAFRPATGLFFLAIFIFDFAATIIRRGYSSKPLMKADRAHIHHVLQAMGLSKNRTLMCLVSFQASMSILGYTLHKLAIADNYQFSAFILAFLFYIAVLKHMWVKAESVRISL